MRDFLSDFYPSPPRRPSPAGPVLIEARGLCFDAGGMRLIDGVDLAVRTGRSTIFMGPNGAGKSLLLRLLHGLIAPTAGEILWHGRPLDRAARRAQAMVFQRPVMLRRSARANLRFALAVRGVRGDERRRRETEALEQAGLSDLARSPARVLSGGEQQRLAVARALACGPELLFLDEPTASLDPDSARAIEGLIAAAQRSGVTVVLVTHDAEQTRRLGQDFVRIEGGGIVDRGSLSADLGDPRSGDWIASPGSDPLDSRPRGLLAGRRKASQ